MLGLFVDLFESIDIILLLLISLLLFFFLGLKIEKGLLLSVLKELFDDSNILF